MTHISNSTILVVGGKILTTDDFVFKARQESVNDVIDDFGPPIINLIVPSELKEGKRIEIIMSGNRTYNPLQASISGSGVTVNSVNVDTDGQVTLQTTLDENALTGDGSELRDVTITTLAKADGSQIVDSDGQAITRSSSLPNAFRVYFAEPRLNDSDIANLEQGQQYTINLSGDKMYDKWDDKHPMTVDMGASISVDSVTVNNRASATVVFTAGQNGQRGSSDVDVATYSGAASQNGESLVDHATIYYRAPEATRLHSTAGPHTIDSDQSNMEIEASETFNLTLTGSRLEGISVAGRLAFIDQENNVYPSLAITNATETTPAGTGAGHSASFTVTAAADAPEVGSLMLQYQTLSATGTHTQIFDCALDVVPADPTIASFTIASREGLIGTDNQAVELGDQVRSCKITGKNIRSEGLSLKVMKDAAGTVSDATGEFTISGLKLTDKAANADDTLEFDIQTKFSTTQTDSAGQLKYFFKIETASGSSSAAAAWGANQLVVLPGNPALTADASGAVNHASLRKNADTGSTSATFVITGSNLYNAVASNADMNDWSAIVDDGSGVFADGDGNGKMKIEMTADAGISNLTCVALSDTNAAVSFDVDNASVVEGLKDITITTRSGSATVAGVLDILPPTQSMSSIVPNQQEEGSVATLTVSGANFFPIGAGLAGPSTEGNNGQKNGGKKDDKEKGGGHNPYEGMPYCGASTAKADLEASPLQADLPLRAEIGEQHYSTLEAARVQFQIDMDSVQTVGEMITATEAFQGVLYDAVSDAKVPMSILSASCQEQGQLSVVQLDLAEQAEDDSLEWENAMTIAEYTFTAIERLDS